MNIFKLSIPDKGNERKAQVFDYIDTWNGDPGLTEIKNFAGCDTLNGIIGEFVWNTVFDSDTIKGIIIYDDNMGNLIDGIIRTSSGFEKLTNLMGANYFDLAVELNSLYHDIDPYNDNNTIVGCLDLINNHSDYVIDGLIKELKERL